MSTGQRALTARLNQPGTSYILCYFIVGEYTPSRAPESRLPATVAQYIVAMEVKLDGSLARHNIRLTGSGFRIRLQWQMSERAPEIIDIRHAGHGGVDVSVNYIVSETITTLRADRFRILRSRVHAVESDGLRRLAQEGDREDEEAPLEPTPELILETR
jgi:hypothetical protein